ncbi:MAG: sugar ABC transporter permease [Acidobacteria bacterium]|nr:sugar ABC transporter permease [Acidobacteriota bacterium]MCB9397648.1 sugar ABC transporter permease [Acidobacteriota bacterium]
MSGELSKKAHLGLHLFMLVFTFLATYPVFWVFAIAFSGKQTLLLADVNENPTFLDRLRAVFPWPEHPSFQSFIDVLSDQPFARWMLNSLIVAGLTTVVSVFLACTAAYAFSRFKFPGQRAGLMAFMVSQMFPGTLMMVPLYIIVVKYLGLGNTWWGLVLVYTTTAIPFCVWMLKGYFDTISIEIEESAILDGASRAAIFFQIVLPLAKPAIAVTALFAFMTGWNEFILASIFMEQETLYTAPVGLRFFVGKYSQLWGYFAAGSILVSIPVVVMFMFTQKFLVSGLTSGGIKG